MEVKKLTKSSASFREIIEINTRNNTKVSFLFTRALIRFLVRIFKLNLSKIFLKKYLNLYEVLFYKNNSYEKYLLKINVLRIECKILLANKKLSEYLKKRIDWANFILNNSFSKKEKNAAKQYLTILNLYGYYNKKPILTDSIKNKESQIYKGKIQKRFYLYGPNSALAPNPKYSNCTIILTKMIDCDIANFKESILILNFYTSNQLTQEDKKLLLKKYNKIYLSSSNNKVESPFKKFNVDIGGHIASPMALGRILNNFAKMHLNSEFIIEGFDFYLSKNSYSGHIKTALPLKHNQLTERMICQSLFDHEALFNFLYVKNIISRLRIKNSQKFIEIMNLSGHQYLKKLCTLRNFHSLMK
jgi:hypothetical protein